MQRLSVTTVIAEQTSWFDIFDLSVFESMPTAGDGDITASSSSPPCVGGFIQPAYAWPTLYNQAGKDILFDCLRELQSGLQPVLNVPSRYMHHFLQEEE